MKSATNTGRLLTNAQLAETFRFDRPALNMDGYYKVGIHSEYLFEGFGVGRTADAALEDARLRAEALALYAD